MAAPYQRARGDIWIVAVFFVLGTVASLAYASRLNPKTATMADFAAVCGVSLLGLLTGMGITYIRNLKRAERIVEWLLSQGYRAQQKPTPEDKEGFFSQIAHLQTWIPLDGGAQDLDWIAEKGHYLCEHWALRGTGEDALKIDTTIFAIPVDTGEQLMTLARIRSKHPAPGSLDVGDSEFARRWSIFGDSGLVPILNERVKSELRSSPLEESWHIGAGWICCAVRLQLSAEGIKQFVERSKRVAELMCAPLP